MNKTVATLKSTRWRTGSQCSRRSTGFMWSQRRVPITIDERRHSSPPTATGSSVHQRCRRTKNSDSDRTGQPVAVAAAGSSRFESSTDRSDVSRQRQLAVSDDAEVTGCVLDSETRVARYTGINGISRYMSEPSHWQIPPTGLSTSDCDN